MKLWSSCLAALLATSSLSAHAALTTLEKTARIAIVGGGVSGVAAAETLVKRGFTNVVVLDAGSTIVPIAHAVHTPNGVYDMDLVYVPSLSWTGSGIEPRFQQVLHEYNAELVPATEFLVHSREPWHVATDETAWRTLANGQRVPVLHNYLTTQLSAADGHQFFQELVRFYHMFSGFYQHHQYDGVHACLVHGLALPDESFRDWAIRHNLLALHARVVVLLNLYGNFPVSSSPACHVLMMLANKMPSILGPGLLLTAAQPEFADWVEQSEYGPLTEVMKRWLHQIHGNLPAFMNRFRAGYSAFFVSIVQKNQIDYRTHARVRAIVPVGRHDGIDSHALRVDIVGEPSLYVDHVIVAARPDQAHDLIPDDHPMKPLFAVVKNHSRSITRTFGVYGVAVLKYDVAPDAGVIASPRFVIDHVQHQGPMVAEQLPSPVSVMRAIKTTDEQVLTVTFQSTLDVVDHANETSLLVHELQRYGFANLTVLQLQHYAATPTRVPADAVAAGWYDAAEQAQGHDGVFFVGEVFAGHGVPTTYLHTRDWCVRTFNLSTAESSSSSPANEMLVTMETMGTAYWLTTGVQEMPFATGVVVVGSALAVALVVTHFVEWGTKNKTA